MQFNRVLHLLIMKYFYGVIPLSLLLLISFNNSVQAQNAKRKAPKPVTPITIGHVKYTAPSDSIGYIVAFDLVTNKWIWSKKIYTVRYIDLLEHDVQDIY